MLRLLLQRGSVLLLRPAALLAEGYFLPHKNFLIFVLPATAMALTMSSVPVYLEFLSTPDHHAHKEKVNKDYLSGLLATIITTVTVLSIILIFLRTTLITSSTILMVFIIEKFADETTRFYEFNKQYDRWFVVQSSRGLWLFFPIGFALLGNDYETSFCVIAPAVALSMITHFFLVTRLRLSLSLRGWKIIAQNAPFLGSSAIISSNRQIPRLAVAYLFPNVAHIFQAMAQISQGVSLLFNVKFMIPHRKIIARRTVVFEGIFRPSFSKIAAASIVISLFGGAVSIAASNSNSLLFFVALGTTMLADAIAFSLMSVYLGLIPWFVVPTSALKTFAVAGCFSITVFVFLYVGIAFLGGSLVLVPMASTLLSLSSIAIIMRRHLESIRHD